MNREEALRCLDIARQRLAQNNTDAAIRFAKKSINLYATPEAQSLLEKLESNTSSPVVEESTTREYTVSQMQLVERIQTLPKTDYYGILGVARDATDTDIKKAYRKVLRVLCASSRVAGTSASSVTKEM
jgi:DnaJ family protein B protein 12